MPVFPPTTALQMAPSGKLLVAPQETPEQDSDASGPGMQQIGQDSGPQAKDALKAALSAPSPGVLPRRDSGPKAGISLENSSSIVVHPGEIAEAKTLPPHLGREGSPRRLCMKPRTHRHGSASWGEGLVTAQGGTLPGTKNSAREGSPGCSLTLPKARVPSTPRDSIQLVKRHHSQPQVGPGCFNHVVSIEIGTLSALHPSRLPEAEARAELREEPENMEMGEPPPGGKKEERENPQAPGAELEEVDLGNTPPTPPLHRFPSWVRGSLFVGQGAECERRRPASWRPAGAEPGLGVVTCQPLPFHEHMPLPSWVLGARVLIESPRLCHGAAHW